ncbi:hypothetical protein HHK36_019774 [Tetracentron sinense]|uniref:Protein FAR1-RELATED SEQUENCE n=1 Tax=Tetracentron sinense TaxID=13715 RepID=A0A834YY50_TETSI|nr:hypothetical protein HHK36_019774 [Tetracentron sinense]
MRGILCSHAIKVLKDVMNIMELPNQYILKRWTRKAKVECVQDMHGRNIQVDARLLQTTWYRLLCSIFTQISFRASESNETYKMVDEKAKELLKVIEDMLNLQIDVPILHYPLSRWRGFGSCDFGGESYIISSWLIVLEKEEQEEVEMMWHKALQWLGDLNFDDFGGTRV